MEFNDLKVGIHVFSGEDIWEVIELRNQTPPIEYIVEGRDYRVAIIKKRGVRGRPRSTWIYAESGLALKRLTPIDKVRLAFYGKLDYAKKKGIV